MSFGLDARVSALESRAEATEILLAEIFGHVSASIEHDIDGFNARLNDLCRRYKYDPEEADAVRRDAAVLQLLFIDAYNGQPCDWDRATQLSHS